MCRTPLVQRVLSLYIDSIPAGDASTMKQGIKPDTVHLLGYPSVQLPHWTRTFGRQRVTGDRQLTRMDSVSVVIPVYSGAETLPGVVKELEQLRSTQETPDGREFRVDEVVLVWDRGIGGSDEVVRELAAR